MDTSLSSLLKQKNSAGSINKKVANTDDFCSLHFKKFITTDEELRADKEYREVFKIIENLWNLGMIQRGAGFCLSVSDTLQKILKANGIDSKLIECELIITTNNPPTLNMVGQDYNEVVSDAQINCHVVCVTNTKIPMLVDISVADYGEKLTGIPFVCERLVSNDNADLCEAKYGNCSYFYNKKPTPILPDIHQKSILDRIKTDKKIFSDLSRLYMLLYILMGISSINFIRGAYDFYAKYLNTVNGFGPNTHIKK